MPDIPQNPSCINGAERNTVSWDDSTGANSYNLYWKNYN